MGKYRKYSPETKVRIVLEVLRGEKSVAQASRDYQIKDSLLYCSGPNLLDTKSQEI